MKKLIRSSLTNRTDDDGFGMPSIPPTWPIATCTPTPVRNPISTARDRKFERKPSRAIRARNSSPPASSAESPASATHCGVAGSSPAMPSEAMPAYMIAAVAESAPTTRCLEEPTSANAAIGIGSCRGR